MPQLVLLFVFPGFASIINLSNSFSSNFEFDYYQNQYSHQSQSILPICFFGELFVICNCVCLQSSPWIQTTTFDSDSKSENEDTVMLFRAKISLTP